jgi:hypothetical protein
MSAVVWDLEAERFFASAQIRNAEGGLGRARLLRAQSVDLGFQCLDALD